MKFSLGKELGVANGGFVLRHQSEPLEESAESAFLGLCLVPLHRRASREGLQQPRRLDCPIKHSTLWSPPGDFSVNAEELRRLPVHQVTRRPSACCYLGLPCRGRQGDGSGGRENHRRG